MQDLHRGEGFVLHGTEVFHRRATCIAGIASSLSVKQRQRIAELEGDVDKSLADVLYFRQHAEQSEREAATQRQQLESTRTSLEAQQRITARRSREVEVSEDERRRLALLVENLTAERDAARRELAMHQALGPSRSAPPAAQGDPKVEEKDERDPTEVRFSLLEFG